MLAHAIARLHLKDPEFMNQFAKRARIPDVLATFNGQVIANIAWAFAKAGIINLRLMDAIAVLCNFPPLCKVSFCASCTFPIPDMTVAFFGRWETTGKFLDSICAKYSGVICAKH